MSKIDNQPIISRIIEIMQDQRPKSERSFALSIGVDPSFFSKIMKGEKAPTGVVVDGIVQKYGANKDYIWTGRGDKYHKYETISARISPKNDHDKYVQCLEEYNQLLKGDNKKLADNVEELKTTLDDVIKILQAQTWADQAFRALVFESLARIDKKATLDQAAWDKKLAEVMGVRLKSSIA